jgi:DNA-binding MarR family transcriptional regulator
MTAGDYSLLHLVARRGPCSSADIARAARITPQAATQQVAQLAAKQMIVRRENPDNRRIMLLEATPRGRDALADIDGRAAALEARLTAGFDPAELDIIRRFLARAPGTATEHAEQEGETK